MISGWVWPRRWGRSSPFWRSAGHADRAVLRRAAAGTLGATALLLAVLAPAGHEVWRVALGTLALLAVPSWLLVAFLSELLSVGAWTARTNAVVAGAVGTAPALIYLGFGNGWITVGPMMAAGALAAFVTWERCWRSAATQMSA